MNISAAAIRPSNPQTIRNLKPEVQQAPGESFTLSGSDGVSWTDAGVGLVGAVAGGAVTGAGAGLSAVKHSALGTVEAYKALWTNETIGPVLKTAMGVLMPVATVGVPVLSALGGAAYGLYQGFVDGATKGLTTALKNSAENVQKFDTDLAADARQGIRDWGNEKLGEGEKAFDISPVNGVKAVAAGLGNTVVGGVGIGVSTLTQIPEAFITGNKVIHASDMGLPLKTVSHVVSVPLAVAAAPLGFVGGALFGLGSGAYHGYTDGFVESFKKTGGYVKKYHESVDEGLAKLAEELVKHPPQS